MLLRPRLPPVVSFTWALPVCFFPSLSPPFTVSKRLGILLAANDLGREFVELWRVLAGGGVERGVGEELEAGSARTQDVDPHPAVTLEPPTVRQLCPTFPSVSDSLWLSSSSIERGDLRV